MTTKETIRNYVPVGMRSDVSEWPDIQWAPRQTATRLTPDGVEVTLTVPVLHRETWGTQRHEHTVVGRGKLSGAGDRAWVRQSIADATDRAYAQALTLAQAIQRANPDREGVPPMGGRY